MTLNRALRRSYGAEVVRWIEQLEEIARDVGCTCGPMHSKLDAPDGPRGFCITIIHADSCPLPTDCFYRDART